MQNDLNIFSDKPGFLCALGSSEWYGVDRRAEELAYEITGWLETQGDANLDNLMAKAQMIINPTLRTNAACQNWEQGVQQDYFDCPATWGNVSLLSEKQHQRLQDPANRIEIALINSSYYSTAHLNDVNGADKGLQFNFASYQIVLPDNFVILTQNQRSVYRCHTVEEYRDPTSPFYNTNRLWIIRKKANDYRYPLCRASRPTFDPHPTTQQTDRETEDVLANNP